MPLGLHRSAARVVRAGYAVRRVQCAQVCHSGLATACEHGGVLQAPPTVVLLHQLLNQLHGWPSSWLSASVLRESAPRVASATLKSTAQKAACAATTASRAATSGGEEPGPGGGLQPARGQPPYRRRRRRTKIKNAWLDGGLR